MLYGSTDVKYSGPGQLWWYVPVILLFWRPVLGDHQFEASLSYVGRQEGKKGGKENGVRRRKKRGKGAEDDSVCGWCICSLCMSFTSSTSLPNLLIVFYRELQAMLCPLRTCGSYTVARAIETPGTCDGLGQGGLPVVGI